MKLKRKIVWISIGALLLSSVLASVGAAGPLVAPGQRITIDSKLVPSGSSGSFRLNALSTGPFGSDAGGWTYAAAGSSKGIRDGQAYRRDQGLTTFTGKKGTLVLRQDETVVSVTTGLRDVGTGTWTVVRGTGAYAGVTGSGRMAGWYIRTGQSLERCDGYLKAKGGP